MDERLLTCVEVQRRTGLSRASVYRRMSQGTFPPSRREPGCRSARWLKSEIDQWIAGWVARSFVGTAVGRKSTSEKPSNNQ
jgi:prophage regulatory protein